MVCYRRCIILIVCLCTFCNGLIVPHRAPVHRASRQTRVERFTKSWSFPGAQWRSNCDTEDSPSRLPPLALGAVNPTLSAATGLVSSSIFGIVADKTFLPNAGILASLGFAAMLSNLQILPATHAIYDLCWTLFVPASLALLIFSDNSKTSSAQPKAGADIGLTGIPFVIGSIGSIVGCFLSFLICRAFPNHWLCPLDAAIAGGCLTASYVGGTVNFFATARIVQGNPTLLSAMAGADILVMAIYFAGLVSAIQNKKIQDLFIGSNKYNKKSHIDSEEQSQTAKKGDAPLPFRKKVLGGILACSLAWLITTFANHVEKMLERFVPGTACAIIVLLGTLIQRYLFADKPWALPIQSVSGNLAPFFFLLFFASIGISANIGQALAAGPACLFFSSFALLIHVVIQLLGSILANRWVNNKIQLRHTLVASNAAIGGPATAATFAGQANTGLTLAASVWGVVGYAIGTNLGVAMTRFLKLFL